MLDLIFYYFAKDKYSEWTIYTRYCSAGGNMELRVPHFYCDGRTLVKTISPALTMLAENHLEMLIPSVSQMKIKNEITILSTPQKTYFQSLLEHLILINEWTDDDLIALAVDISSTVNENYKLQGNKVSFPVFNVKTLRHLCLLKKEKWKAFINAKANEEFKNYHRISEALSKMTESRRRGLYEKMPIHSAKAIISYLGGIERLVDIKPEVLQSLDFAASTTRGPKQTILGFSIGGDTYFRIVEENEQFDWNNFVFKFKREEEVK